MLVKKIKYTAKIKLLSNLHIGGTNTSMAIGGVDKFVVRNPIDQKPYIPGSSLKGKMRSLFELATGTYKAIERDQGYNYGPSTNRNDKSGSLFGTSASNVGQPSRLIVRDAPMTDGQEDKLSRTDLYLTESKTEVSIDRIKASANPRTNEVVPRGVLFDFEAVLNIFSGDDEATLCQSFETAKRLLEDDYLGGNGSRGYGHIAFEDWRKEEKPIEKY